MLTHKHPCSCIHAHSRAPTGTLTTPPLHAKPSLTHAIQIWGKARCRTTRCALTTRDACHIKRLPSHLAGATTEIRVYRIFCSGAGHGCACFPPLPSPHVTRHTLHLLRHVTRDEPRCVRRQEQNTRNGGQVLQSRYRLLRVRSHACCLLPVSCFSCHAARLHYYIFSHLIQVRMGRVFSFCSCEERGKVCCKIVLPMHAMDCLPLNDAAAASFLLFLPPHPCPATPLAFADTTSA